MDYSPWHHKESATTEQLTHTHTHKLTHVYIQASLVAQAVKNLAAMWETRVGSLCWKDSLEVSMASRSSILVWRIPWTEEPEEL